MSGKKVEIEITTHMQGVIGTFNRYRQIVDEEKVAACSFDIEAVLTQQAWILAVYFADQLKGAV